MLKISSENQWFQRAEALKRSRKKRQQCRQFLVEGVQSINQLVANDGWNVEAILYAAERRRSNWAQGIIANSQARWHLEFTEGLLAKLSEKEEPSELLAIVEMPTDDLSRVPARENALIVLVDRPQSPGNLGTIIRSCEALGVHGMIITGHATVLFDQRTVRATAGSFFALPAVRVASHTVFETWLNAIRPKFPELQVVGTSAHAQIQVASCDFTRPTILVVGNEARGLSRWFQEFCQPVVAISMTGSTRSLNVACATTAILYEIQRQRS